MTRIFDEDLDYRFATKVIHAGQRPDPLAGAVIPPIFQTSTYVLDSIDHHKGYDYARSRNPTRDALERCVASLEGATHGIAFGSGIAATDAVLKLLRAGDHVICGENVYGGVYRLMHHVFEPLGLRFTFVDSRDPRRIEDAITTATRMVYVETPTNPLMHLTDLEAVGPIARARDLVFVVDNTFATPFFQRPIALGADLVVHSSTKYLNGHSDIIGGLVATNRDDLAERLMFIQKSSGAVPGPMDCWLTLRGVKTLQVRMRQHDAAGRKIAEWLVQNPRISQVLYPGLPSHPQYELANRQMSGYGGMISFELRDQPSAKKFVERTRIFALAESLGGVESLICLPALMTHASVPAEMRRAMGLTDSLVRISIGIEDVDDLIGDLEQALDAAHA